MWCVSINFKTSFRQKKDYSIHVLIDYKRKCENAGSNEGASERDLELLWIFDSVQRNVPFLSIPPLYNKTEITSDKNY